MELLPEKMAVRIFYLKKNWNSFVDVLQEAKALIWGRKTYEVVMNEYGEKYLDTIKDIKKVVVSSDENFKLDERFELAKSPKEALAKLEEQGFNEVVLSGGSFLNSSFAKQKLVNEIVFNVEPVVIGKGLAVFASEEFDLKLSEPGIKNIADGIIQLRYKVL